MNLIDFTCQMQEAKLAVLRAQAAAPNTKPVQEATLDAIRSVGVDCCRDDVMDSIRFAWAQKQAD
jgi:hypothetical protein